MIIDFHTHVGTDVGGESQTVAELLESMERTGIERSVVFPFNSDDSTLIDQSIKILEVSKKNRRIIPFVRFNPNTITTDELTRLLDMGFKGVKLHPNVQNFMPNDEKFFWIYTMIEKAELPVIFHSKLVSGKTSDPSHLLDVAKSFPNLTIVMGHFFGDVMKVIPEAKRYPNLYTETSLYSRTLRLREVVEKHGFDRIMLGSDAPYDAQDVALLKVKLSGLPTSVIDKILSGNALNILKENGTQREGF